MELILQKVDFDVARIFSQLKMVTHIFVHMQYK